MRASKHHLELTDGVGKCSVPMWMNGLPAGFCDKPAYGKQETDQRRYGRHRSSDGQWLPGYCGGLACVEHGGPPEPAKEENSTDEQRTTLREYLRETAKPIQALYNVLPDDHPMRQRLAELMTLQSRIAYVPMGEQLTMPDTVEADPLTQSHGGP